MSLETTLDKIFERYDFLKDEMLKTVNNVETFAKISKEFSDLEDIVSLGKKYKKSIHYINSLFFYL